MGLTYYGQDLFEEFGIMVDSSQTWKKPERDMELVHVPGRNGDLILDNGCWQNVEIEYNCHIDNNFAEDFERFTAWLSYIKAYQELYDEKHPDVYRVALARMDIEPETTFTDQTAHFTLVFTCKPQQYINDGVDRVLHLDFSTETEDGDADPDGDWFSNPLLTVYGATNGAYIILGDADAWTLEIAPFTKDRIVIDFETGDAIFEDEMGEYDGNANPYISLTPPVGSMDELPHDIHYVEALHTDPADEENEYTGTMEFDPRFWKI